MIQRHVYVKLIDDLANDEGRAEVARHSEGVLSGLSMVRAARVGLPADEASTAAWDLVLIVTLDSMDDVATYAVDADHLEYVRGYLNPRALVKKAWNFTV
jgi:hypothetical protein